MEARHRSTKPKTSETLSLTERWSFDHRILEIDNMLRPLAADITSIQMIDSDEIELSTKVSSIRHELDVALGEINDLRLFLDSEEDTSAEKIHEIKLRRVQHSTLHTELRKALAIRIQRLDAIEASERRALLLDSSGDRVAVEVVESLRRTFNLLSEEAERSDASIKALIQSTEALRHVSSTQDAVSREAETGGSILDAIRRVEVRDRLIIGACFLFFLFVALMIVRKRFKVVNLWPGFLP